MLDTDALLIPGRGNVLVGDGESAVIIPTYAELLAYAADYTNPPPGFVTIGHTDPEDLPEWDSDGGDSETKRTWEQENVREVLEPETQWFVAKPLQNDNFVFNLRFGGGDVSQPNVFTVPANRGTIERPALITYIDSSGGVVGELIERTSIRSEGPAEHEIDEFSKYPLRFTRLSPPGGGSGYHFIGAKFGTPATP